MVRPALSAAWIFFHCAVGIVCGTAIVNGTAGIVCGTDIVNGTVGIICGMGIVDGTVGIICSTALCNTSSFFCDCHRDACHQSHTTDLS